MGLKEKVEKVEKVQTEKAEKARICIHCVVMLAVVLMYKSKLGTEPNRWQQVYKVGPFQGEKACLIFVSFSQL